MTTIAVTYQPPVGSTQTYGDGSPLYILGSEGGAVSSGSGIGGMDDVTINAFDSQRQFGDYDVQGPHVEASPIITLPLFTAENLTPEEAVALINDLRAGWRRAPDLTDEATLTVNRWGDIRVFTGAPFGVKFKTGMLLDGYFSALCSFKVYAEVLGS